jgi:hypothetical protein
MRKVHPVFVPTLCAIDSAGRSLLTKSYASRPCVCAHTCLCASPVLAPTSCLCVALHFLKFLAKHGWRSLNLRNLSTLWLSYTCWQGTTNSSRCLFELSCLRKPRFSYLKIKSEAKFVLVFPHTFSENTAVAWAS